MTDQFLGEIRMFAGNFAPQGWALCLGQLLPLSQNAALFSLLGTNYGGDGKSTFALPNLGTRMPIGAGQGPGLTERELGEAGGSESVTLAQSQIPAHTHQVSALAAGGTATSPAGATWAQPHLGRVTEKVYAASTASGTMHSQALATTGGSQPHNNLPPYLVVSFIIALQGIFPSRP
ncbi:phage tail protein [Humibacter albus]|uniref:phage tail protein n=1 Tax=Humibacter albus TaxID=427754 RepID=UPI0003B2ED5E|nr:tail fiber protein [Humibacter albus]